MTGQGASGMCVCFLLIIIKIIYSKTDQDPVQGYTLFFYLSALVSILALLGYIAILRSPFAKYHLGTRNQSSFIDQSFSLQREGEHLPDADATRSSVRYSTVFKKLWKSCPLIALVFIGTFIMFPGLTSILQSSAFDKSWFPLLLVTAFNVFDTIGRFGSGLLQIKGTSAFWILVISRFFLYPFFVVHKMGFFQGIVGDCFAFSMVSILALSNGYLASLIMMKTSSCVERHEEEVASAVMTFFLMGGIFVGLHIALLIHFLIPSHL
jgi:solute carrier family 29 (equilibrative nucleoside transporter), member 1/2/3